MPRHDSQAAGRSSPSTCSLYHACVSAAAAVTRTAQSIKLQCKNKFKKKEEAVYFFSLVLGKSRYISLFVPNKTCG